VITSSLQFAADCLAQWFLTRGEPIDFKGVASPYALCNMESSGYISVLPLWNT